MEGPPCTAIELAGDAFPVGQPGHRWVSTSLSREGDLVVAHEQQIHWLDAWSAWPPTLLGERALDDVPLLGPGLASGVTALTWESLVLSTVHFDLHPTSEGEALELLGRRAGPLTRVGDGYWTLTDDVEREVVRLHALTADQRLAWTHELLHCAGDDEWAPRPALLRSTDPSRAWLALGDTPRPNACLASHGEVVVYALDPAGNGDAVTVANAAGGALTSVSLVPGTEGPLLIYGFTPSNPALTTLADLWMLQLDADASPLGEPSPLPLTGLGSSRVAVVPVAGGFVVARWVAEATPLPTEVPLRIALFDREGELLQEISTNEVNQQGGGLYGAPSAVASGDGRSIVIAWAKLGPAFDVANSQLRLLRLDCTD